MVTIPDWYQGVDLSMQGANISPHKLKSWVLGLKSVGFQWEALMEVPKSEIRMSSSRQGSLLLLEPPFGDTASHSYAVQMCVLMDIWFKLIQLLLLLNYTIADTWQLQFKSCITAEAWEIKPVKSTPRSRDLGLIAVCAKDVWVSTVMKSKCLWKAKVCF